MNTLDPLNQHKQLTRSQRDKKLMGVCGGIAEYMGWDVTLVRITAVVLLLVAHVATLVGYFILAAIMPAEQVTTYTPNQYPPQQPQQQPEQPTPHPYD